MSGRIGIIAVAIAGAGLAAVLAFSLKFAAPAPAPIAGMVRQTEIRIAPEINGRLAQIAVAPGQRVAKGDLLATIDNPDLVAAVGEAEAELASARAEREHVYAGVRAEELDIAAEAVRTADANLTLARQQNARVAALAGRGFSSRAQLDESDASLAKALANLDLKQAQLTAARNGPTTEERALADSRVALAGAGVEDAKARLEKTRLTAPVVGTVGMKVAEPGEVLVPGKPVLTFIPDDDRLWIALTLREDELRGLAIGGRTHLRVAGTPIDAIVTELRPLGEFATWRAARAVGEHDLNSFRLRLEPLGPTPEMQPGMTAFLDRSGGRESP